MGLEGIYAPMFTMLNLASPDNTARINPFAPIWREKDEVTTAVDVLVHEEAHQVVLREEGEAASRGIDKMLLFLEGSWG